MTKVIAVAINRAVLMPPTTPTARFTLILPISLLYCAGRISKTAFLRILFCPRQANFATILQNPTCS